MESLNRVTKEAYDFYFDYDPEFTWWMPEPWKKLNVSMTDYAKGLREHYTNSVKDDGSGIIGKPIGREALEKQLAFEMIAYSPEELIAEAEKQFAWCEKEMFKASNELGFGNDWKAALEMVKKIPIYQLELGLREWRDWVRKPSKSWRKMTGSLFLNWQKKLGERR
ncbi:hypothetical protein [Algoriphagus boritolerans]|uniref:hypothetical protein n=1 Tax=Algoriphagus boritolerans TaxID=308111 RepID=UPI002FCDF5C1